MTDVMMLEESDYASEEFFDEDSESDFDEEENVVVVAKKPKAKKDTGAKKTVASVLSPNLNAGNVSKPKALGKGKTIEQIYQKKSQLEHILLRPDTYIGSVERVTQPMFVFDSTTERIVERNITFTPGLYKIFDEIIVNASDNKQRDPNMDKLEVVIDQEANKISVKNTGKGIPIVKHKEHDCYVPTLIFGHLLTGSNFDDDERKTTGGRNGYGAKLANIFSHEFIVECVDSENGLKFKQVFSSNMSKAGEPSIKDCTAAEKKQGDYTKIMFSPDLQRFKMGALDDDSVALLSKRAYDIAGSMANRGRTRLVVSLNGKKLPVKSFQDYLKLFDGINEPVAYEKVGDRWEVGIAVSDGSFQQISFVNSICTSKGGGHVTYIADQVAASLAGIVKKKNKGGIEVKANQIKNHLCVFVNCLVENPTFDSQTKEHLTTRPKSLGSTCDLSPKFLKQVGNSGVVDAILQYAKFKQNQALKNKGGKKKSKLTGIPKLDDANHAGTAKSKDCTLIITEGDSAKSLAMSGLSVVGRDFYGVFPLKGKPLNVREASHKQIMSNEEIKNLIDIMGFKHGVIYDENNVKTLRYGHLMIMADQDHDGSHIKGLIINMIHHFWPSLLDISGFLQQFITPIVKATKKSNRKISKTFFTIPEYESWKESTDNDAKGWTIKYYKGLGTSTSQEAKEYFGNLGIHEVHFSELSSDKTSSQAVVAYDSDAMDFEDPAPDKVISGSDLIEMAFSKGRVEDRKIWLNNLEKDTYLNYSEAQEDGVKYSDFINKELILFSQADNQRSIPHLMDGFKPSQRKVLFACIKKKLTHAKPEMKVAQLAGYIGEHSAYHHGEASLHGTIVNMAQSFCGSNNVNLLTPSGQFGTRRMGGKDSASPRYIFTKLEKVARTIFHPDDDAILTYLNDDGMSIEPEYYMPVIPLVLVNGSEGIGTGWSSNVPNFCPRAIIANLRHLIAGKELEKMVPHFYGFTGDIVAETGKREGSYVVQGRIERKDDTTLFISELPIKRWTQDYKVFLESMATNDGKTDPDIKDFQENHTDTTISFTITAAKEKIDAFEKEKNGLCGKFKLTGSLSTSNMTLFDKKGRITRYEKPEDILFAFYELRLDYYSRRKELLLKNLKWDQKMLSNKARFVEEVCSGDLVVSNRKRTDILADLQERGYDLLQKEDTNKTDEDSDEETDDTETDAELAKGYEYLLGMKIWSLTFEKAEELRAKFAEKTQEVAELEETSPSQIWQNDLDAIEVALDERDAEMEAAAKEEVKAQKKNTKQQAKKASKAAAKRGQKKKKGEWDSDDESSSSEDEVGKDESDDDIEPKKKAPVKSKSAPKQRKVVMKDENASASVPSSAKPVAKPKVDSRMAPLPAKLAGNHKVTAKKVTSPMKEDSSLDEERFGLPRPVPAKSTAKQKVGAKKVSSPMKEDSSSDEEGFGLSLAERLGKKKPLTSLSSKKSSSMQEESNASDDSFTSFDASEFKPASLTPAAKKAATKKVAAKRPRGTTEDKKSISTTVSAAARKSAKKNKIVGEFDFEDSDVEVVAAPVPARTRPGRARAKVSYNLLSDEDEGEDSDSDF